MVVRAQHSDEWPAVRRVLAEALADDGRVATLAEALHARADRPVEVALVAESDGELVGHVRLSRARIDAQPALVEALVLSPLGVAPAHQHRGIGRALCDGAVARPAAAGSSDLSRGRPGLLRPARMAARQ